VVTRKDRHVEMIVMTVLMIAPIHLVVTRKDRHVEMISMQALPVLPL
jgi:hypothetical protein